MVQEEKGDAYMFFQISIDKDGVVTGAFKNLLSGETSPISGQVDKKTQRVAWKIGSNSSTVIETGLQNLTQEVASCLVHFGTDTTQTWLLVRLKNPDMPKTPAIRTCGGRFEVNSGWLRAIQQIPSPYWRVISAEWITPAILILESLRTRSFLNGQRLRIPWTIFLPRRLSFLF